MLKIFLPSVVTVYNPHPENQIEEIKKYGLKKIALFLTGVPFLKRQEIIKRLKDIPGLSIPFVHTRSDMGPGEYQELVDNFKTEIFNLHPETDFPLKFNLDTFKDKILIENSGRIEGKDLVGYRGLCLDLSHLEERRLEKPKEYEEVYALAEKYPIGANHISAIRDFPDINELDYLSFDNHLVKSLSELDYLKRYPAKFFGKYIAMELINPIKKQLELIDYVKKILKEKGLRFE